VSDDKPPADATPSEVREWADEKWAVYDHFKGDEERLSRARRQRGNDEPQAKGEDHEQS
jgi:hypothetical protein